MSSFTDRGTGLKMPLSKKKKKKKKTALIFFESGGFFFLFFEKQFFAGKLFKLRRGAFSFS